MKHAKICLTCILKDDTEAEMAQRMLESFMPHCKGLAAVITGVSGKHEEVVKLIKKHKGKYVIATPENNPDLYSEDEEGIFFSNFATARSISFGLADTMGEFDWYAWADVDDILINGQELIPAADKALEMGVDSVFFTYWYSVQIRKDNTFTDQDVEVHHIRERLLRPHMFKWISRLHEVAVPIEGNYTPKNTVYEYDKKNKHQLVWVHLTSDKRLNSNLQRNIRILKLQMEEQEGKDPRTLFYLARCYFEQKTDEYDTLALDLLEKYLTMSGWRQERANAWVIIGDIQYRRGAMKASLEAYFEATKEYPDSHMVYLLIARAYAEMKVFDQSDFWLDVALKLPPPKAEVTIGNPLEIKYMAASLMFNRSIRLQKLDEALYWAKARQDISQKEDGLYETLQDAKKLNDAAKNVMQYAHWLKDTKNTDKVEKLLESLPDELGKEPFAAYIANDIKKPKVWSKKSIVFYASFGAEHFEKWSGKSLETGIGGSETAVIELAKRWAKDGYDVTVYGDPREDAGKIDGVQYKPWYECNWNDTFNVLILWRSPHLLDRDIKAKKIFMDLHDVASQLDWNEKRMEKIDKVFFKSNYHRRMLPKLPEEKAVVISNGIQL